MATTGRPGRAEFGAIARSVFSSSTKIDTDTEDGARIRGSSAMWAGPPREYRIPKPLLERVSQISDLGYRDQLVQFSRDFLKQLRVSPNTEAKLVAVDANCARLVRDAYTGLISWAAEELGIDGARLRDRVLAFMGAEPILYRIPEGYRDHLVHPLAVLLAGSVVLDWQLDAFASLFDGMTDARQETDSARVQAAWVLASAFHDVGIVMQKWDDAGAAHVGDILGCQARSNPEQFALDREARAQCCTHLGTVASLLHHCCLPATGTQWSPRCAYSTPGYQHLRAAFTRADPSVSHHPSLGAIALLDGCGPLDASQARVVLPAALAIALHHDHGDALSRITRGNGIRQTQQPLTFLLRICDLATEWFRPKMKPVPGGFSRLGTGHNLEDFSNGDEGIFIECNVGESDIVEAQKAIAKQRQVVADVDGLRYRVKFTSEDNAANFAETSFDGP